MAAILQHAGTLSGWDCYVLAKEPAGNSIAQCASRYIMKVTLRNKTTGEFFAGLGKWVSSAVQAYNFGYSDEAEECCEKLGLPDVNVFYIFKLPQSTSGTSAA
jgi:hypothetical protein